MVFSRLSITFLNIATLLLSRFFVSLAVFFFFLEFQRVAEFESRGFLFRIFSAYAPFSCTLPLPQAFPKQASLKFAVLLLAFAFFPDLPLMALRFHFLSRVWYRTLDPAFDKALLPAFQYHTLR